MKKLFDKANPGAIWIGAAIAGTLAAGAGIWFYLQGKRAAALEAQVAKQAQDYLKRKNKKKKRHQSDVNDLKDIVHHPQE